MLSRITTTLLAIPLAILFIVCMTFACVVVMCSEDDGPWYSP